MWFWRRPPAEEGPIDVVYVWPTTKGYYAEKVVPRRLDIRARPSDSAELVSARLPAGVRSFLFHIDMTDSARFPSDRSRLVEELRARSVRVLNAQVTDISKRAVHAVAQRLGLPCTLASHEGQQRELLIVKTDRNYGGRSERLLSGRDRRLLHLTAGFPLIRDTFDYKLMPRVEVPEPWWEDPQLVLERFVTDHESRLHRVHVVLNHFAFWSGVCNRPIKKIRDCWDTCEFFLRRGQMESALPPALLRTVYDFAEAFSLDYGALDLVADDAGRYYVIDANSTPWRGTESSERFAFLQAGWDNAPCGQA
jgi:hypothetical protein